MRMIQEESFNTLGGRGWLDENDIGGVVQYLGRRRMARRECCGRWEESNT